MPWEFIVALIIAIPIILFPAAFIWYLNVGGMVQAMKRARARRAARQARVGVVGMAPSAPIDAAGGEGPGGPDGFRR